MDLSGSFDREAAPAECVLDCRDVVVHLGDRSEADLARLSRPCAELVPYSLFCPLTPVMVLTII